MLKSDRPTIRAKSKCWSCAKARWCKLRATDPVRNGREIRHSFEMYKDCDVFKATLVFRPIWKAMLFSHFGELIAADAGSEFRLNLGLAVSFCKCKKVKREFGDIKAYILG